jgi:hypothetical protein
LLRPNRDTIKRATQSTTAAILAGDQKGDLTAAVPSEMDGIAVKSAADETLKKSTSNEKRQENLPYRVSK